MIKEGKVIQYQLFWIRNHKGLRVAIFLDKKWIDKVTDTNWVDDQTIVIKEQVETIFVLAIPVYVSVWLR